MEKIKIEKKDDSLSISLAGELMVEDAILLKKELQQAIGSAETVRFEFGKEANPHAAVMQLILALKKELERSGKKLIIAESEEAPVKKSLEMLGVAIFL